MSLSFTLVYTDADYVALEAAGELDAFASEMGAALAAALGIAAGEVVVRLRAGSVIAESHCLLREGDNGTAARAALDDGTLAAGIISSSITIRAALGVAPAAGSIAQALTPEASSQLVSLRGEVSVTRDVAAIAGVYEGLEIEMVEEEEASGGSGDGDGSIVAPAAGAAAAAAVGLAAAAALAARARTRRSRADEALLAGGVGGGGGEADEHRVSVLINPLAMAAGPLPQGRDASSGTIWSAPWEGAGGGTAYY